MAKTDTIDAQSLALCAQHMKPELAKRPGAHKKSPRDFQTANRYNFSAINSLIFSQIKVLIYRDFIQLMLMNDWGSDMGRGKHRRRTKKSTKSFVEFCQNSKVISDSFNKEYSKTDLIIDIKKNPSSDEYYFTLNSDNFNTDFTLNWSSDRFINEYTIFCDYIYNYINKNMSNGQFKDFCSYANNVFRQIFHNDEARKFLCNLYEDPNQRYIKIVSDDFCFPWAFLSPYGYQVIQPFIGREIIFNRLFKGHTPEDKIRTNRQASLMMFKYSPLKHIVDEEYPDIRQKCKDNRIKFYDVNGFNQATHSSIEVRDLIKVNKADIIHFACIGTFARHYTSSQLIIDDEFIIAAPHFHDEAFKFNHTPIVFLNSCETGVIHPNSLQSFVRIFNDFGASTIIAPECKVPDRSAAIFSKIYCSHLFSGKCVRDALLLTRDEMVQSHQDYSGFAYGIYGRGDRIL